MYVQYWWIYPVDGSVQLPEIFMIFKLLYYDLVRQYLQHNRIIASILDRVNIEPG